MDGAAWLFQWGGQLSSLAENLVEKVPDEEEWNVIRGFLQNVSSVFRRGDIRSGARAFYKVMPYVQRALASTEKTTNINKTYDLTASIAEHFLVEDTTREEISNFMLKVKDSLTELRVKVESFASDLDILLEDVLLEGRDITIMESIKLAFKMNRISAHIKSCEDKLLHARKLIDDLDTHIAGKTFLAVLLSYVAFFCGVVFSSTGQFPLGAACITAASASRKSAQGLYAYRKELIKLNAEHINFQSELAKWRNNFRSEQINFLLLFGIKRISVFSIGILITLLIIGKTANFILFAVLFMYFVIKAEETNSKKYMAAIGIGVLAMFIEVQRQNGLIAFNGLSSMILCLCYLGFMDF